MTRVKQSSYKEVGVVKRSVLQFRGEPNGHSGVIANLFYTEQVKVLNKEHINVRKCFWTLKKRMVRHVGEVVTKEVVLSCKAEWKCATRRRNESRGHRNEAREGERRGEDEKTIWDRHFQAFLLQAG